MRRRSILVLACTGLTLLVYLRPAAAASDEDMPDAVVQRALDAMNHDKLDEFAGLMHPAALNDFHTVMSSVVDAAAKQGKAEELFPLFQVKEMSELKKLDDHQFFVRFMRGVTGQNPDLKETMAKIKTTVLGHVPEGKETVHVVYRMKLPGGDSVVDQRKVISVRKNNAKWGMMLLGDTEAMTAMLKQQLTGKPVAPDFKASKIQPLGHILEGKESAQVVYRMVTPLGDATTSKVAVLTVNKSDPGWNAVLKRDNAALEKLIKEELGL